MIELRPAAERGHAEHGWLDSWHSFSFAEYQHPKRMRFGPLRVINEDRIKAGTGFGRHGHRDMEIISYVLSGALAHEDSMGNRAVIVPGEVQRMSAGSGVQHAEFNRNPSGMTHFLQIWIEPDRLGAAPSYEQRAFPVENRRGRLTLVLSPDGREDTVSIRQDALLYAGLFDGDEATSYVLPTGRLGYLHLARGQVSVNAHRLQAGDALAFDSAERLQISAGLDADLLVFDLPST